MNTENFFKTALMVLAITIIANAANAAITGEMFCQTAYSQMETSTMTEMNYSFTGSYTGTSYTIHVKCTTGADKGNFKVYLHNGDKYIKFSNSWIKLGNGRFSFNGNSYVFTFC